MSNSQHELFLKDTKSGAYVNTDDAALNAFKNAREEAKVTKHVMNELSNIKKELIDIKSFMVDIKSALEELTK